MERANTCGELLCFFTYNAVTKMMLHGVWQCLSGFRIILSGKGNRASGIQEPRGDPRRCDLCLRNAFVRKIVTGREVVAGMLNSGSCIVVALESEASEDWGSCHFTSF